FNDGSGTTTVDLISGNDGTLTNMTIDDWVNSTAPVPFESSGDGNWSEASNWLSGQGYPATPWARAKVNSNLTLNQDFEMLELQVPIGKSLTLPPGKGLTITDTIDNKAGPSGIVLKSDATGQATLIQTSDSVDATVERYLTQGAYHYISSPVSNQNISTEFVDASSNPLPSTVDFYRFDEPANMWRNIKDGSGNLNNSFETQFVVSRGYAYANSNAVFTKNFSGELNYDDLTVTLTKQGSSANNGWNMVGNIYPANLAANTSADVDHNFLTDNATALDDNHEAIYLYDGNDYVAVNQASAESYIAPTQGFFVKAATNQAQLAFNAADQKHTTATFYKNGSTDSRFTIRITNPQSETNEILLAFIPGKSQGLDPGYDAQKLKGNSNLALYSLLVDDDGNDYAIQSLPQVDNQHVKLGLDAAQPGLYEFGNIAMENLNYSTIFLEDKTENLWVNLDLNPSYQFTLSQTGSFKDRFVLHFGGIVTNMEELSEERNITIFSDGDFIFLQNLSSEKQAGSFQLYNLAGQLLVNRELAIEAHSRVSVPTHCAAGMYLVSLLNTKKVYTQKVILK
ncbi:MAG: T9SS type A sorting domain-containing protein, partial [Bacteroidales bacterium]|nr:T9SS type A sorting domain-containing protein [Bacteroidales bacterium]